MVKREITCIGCPMGCALIVDIDNGVVAKVSGNSCKIGEGYAQEECTNPTRIVTSSIEVEGGVEALVSVKTERAIPKEKLIECMKGLKNVVVKAPVHIGYIIIKDIAETGVNIIATKEVAKK